MVEKLNELCELVLQEISEVNDLKSLNELRVTYLGKKGPIQELSAHLRELSIEEKKSFGATLNSVTTKLNEAIDSKRHELEEIELNKKLESEKIDISLPALKLK